MNDLQISDALALPIDAAAARFVALGKSGSGKTNAGTVLAEELLAHGVTTAIIDVLGNMYGLRAAGDGPGLPIAILGGLNGDVPLRADRGAVVADLVADGGSAVLDLSQLTRDDAQTFVADFFTRLVPAVRATGRNVHVIVEEAETFAPERVTGKAHNAVRSATTVFARTARNFGIGWMFSTQRPQLLAKDVIDSSTAFLAMKMTGDLAQEAIGAEVRSRVGKTLASEIMADLPKLRRGEAWLVPDPDWLGDDRDAQPVKFQFRWRHTFDGARAPRVGERREEPRAIADVDLDALRTAMAEDAPRQAADDSGEVATLRARVVELERELERRLQTIDRAVDFACANAVRIVSEALESVQSIRSRISRASKDEVAPVAPEQVVLPDEHSRSETRKTDAGNARPEPTAASRTRPAETSPSTASGDAKLGASPLTILRELATSTPDGAATRTQLAFLAGFAHAGGSYARYLTTLRSAGAIADANGQIRITPAGYEMLGGRPPRNPKKSRDVLAGFRGKLGAGPRKIFDALVPAWPGGLLRDEIAKRTEYEPSGGSFARYLTTLSSARLIERKNGSIRLVDELFPSGKP